MSIHPSTSRNILLVEDNPGDVRLTLEALKGTREQQSVNVATNGADALHQLRGGQGAQRTARPGLIVLDLNLPRKNGREVLREIKEDPDLSLIPIVVFSSSSSEEDIGSAYRLRANSYVTKPRDVDDFIRVVRAISSFWLNTATLPESDS